MTVEDDRDNSPLEEQVFWCNSSTGSTTLYRFFLIPRSSRFFSSSLQSIFVARVEIESNYAPDDFCIRKNFVQVDNAVVLQQIFQRQQ
jgi:hypothetical protein